MQWIMLQQSEPKDYVIATGKQHSIREFIIWTANSLGIDIEFKGSGIKEVGIITNITGDLAPRLEWVKKLSKLIRAILDQQRLKRFWVIRPKPKKS